MEQVASLGNLLRRTWKVYTVYFGALFIMSLIVVAPLYLVSDAFPAYEGVDPLIAALSSDTSSVAVEYDSWQSGVAAWMGIHSDWVYYGIGLQVLFSLASIVMSVLVALLVRNIAKGREVDVRALFREMPRFIVPTILAGLLSGILLVPLTLLLVVPGIIFMVYWTFVAQAVVIGEKRGRAALRYSYRLVRGNWWTVLWYLLSVLFLLLLIVTALSWSVSGLFYVDAYGISALLSFVFHLVLLYGSVFAVVLYYELEHVRLHEIRERLEELQEEAKAAAEEEAEQLAVEEAQDNEPL